MKAALKRALFALLGKAPEPVVLVAGHGPHEEEMRRLVRNVPVLAVPLPDGGAGEAWLALRRAARGRRVALCAARVDDRRALLAALAAFPFRVLAFNSRLERHHVHWREPAASLLFLAGVPRDRIFLRPRWLAPWKRDRSVLPREWRPQGGRGFRAGRPRVAVVSPYLPWPQAHGGAIRIANLLEKCSEQFDIVLFGFEDAQTPDDYGRMRRICAFVYAADKPRWREPRWSTLLPPEACEFYSPELDAGLRRLMQEHGVTLLQAEYTQMARYRPDILVEHDVTWDLFAQVHARRRSLASWWDLWRWRRFERKALQAARRIVVMSAKDAALAGVPDKTVIIPNGVDLARFRPAPEPAGGTPELLFVGSFRHFPNVRAFLFLLGEVWPRLAGRRLRLTVVAGPQPELYWTPRPLDDRIALLGYVADVQPLYERATLVLIPTVVSAGTNLKALEAMASQRAIVSTPSGVAGLGLVHGESVWLAESADEFAAGILRLLEDAPLRQRLAAAARRYAELHYGWEAIACRQMDLWRELLGGQRKE
ncbi:MAG: glycosyltransferase family 4 protein [Bryobacteraceae bacterium]|nr:glycosyltransferase family 4 protein [Bryobacteraceae bacterium]